MANMRRILGAMLASRMAGRGGMAGSIASAAMMGGLRGKAGLATLGYLAYRAYRGEGRGAEPGRESGGAEPAGTGARPGGIGGMIDSLIGGRGGEAGAGPTLGERVDAALNPQPAEPQPAEPAPEEVAMSDGKALLLIRAMIAAASSDGTITAEERARIVAKLDEAGTSADDRRVVDEELKAPKPLDALLREVADRETAQQFYMASRAAVDGKNRVQESYLSYLRQRLGLSEDEAAEIERLSG